MAQLLQVGLRDVIVGLEAQGLEVALLRLGQFAVDVEHGAEVHVAGGLVRTDPHRGPVVLLRLGVAARLAEGVGRVEHDLVLVGREGGRPHELLGRLGVSLALRQKLACV